MNDRMRIYAPGASLLPRAPQAATPQELTGDIEAFFADVESMAACVIFEEYPDAGAEEDSRRFCAMTSEFCALLTRETSQLLAESVKVSPLAGLIISLN